MTEQECLDKMVPPGKRRPNKWMGGVVQVMVTRACDKSCYHCTQGSNLGGKPVMMTVDEFRLACRSLKGYFGVVGMFGGNPAMHPQFNELCAVMREEVPFEQRGLWCNNPITLEKARTMRATFNPAVSNLNVHMDYQAHRLFKQGWPESNVFGLREDSRHSPTMVAMKDVLRKPCPDCQGTGWADLPGERLGVKTSCLKCDGNASVYDEDKAHELIGNCDINQHWSALVGVVPGKGLRAFFCEIAYAQAALHAGDPSYPDTGIPVPELYHRTSSDEGECAADGVLGEAAARYEYEPWWKRPMEAFAGQVRKHCHECSVPLRRYGELALSGTKEEVSTTHQSIYKPKDKNRRVELVMADTAGDRHLALMTDYIGNARR